MAKVRSFAVENPAATRLSSGCLLAQLFATFGSDYTSKKGKSCPITYFLGALYYCGSYIINGYLAELNE